ncbi:MAG: hypothetical protein H0T79_16615 [Deltaproteobacteria bacterium]|nr:hypothetical protein [Deltaproteobacteria bacterium]
MSSPLLTVGSSILMTSEVLAVRQALPISLWTYAPAGSEDELRARLAAITNAVTQPGSSN